MPASEIDSDELEELEQAAEQEELEDADLQALIDEAEAAFPEERIKELKRSVQELGIRGWVQHHVIGKKFNIQHFLIAVGVLLPKELRDSDVPVEALVPVLKAVLIRLLRQRERLAQYNTPDDAVNLIKTARNIVVLTGAGISVSCGIPDFRSRDGIYASLAGKYDLDEPENMFDKEYFMQQPSVFFDFAHSIFPSNFKPSPSHRFIKLLEDKEKLLRNYTQNIDTLEKAAGITRVLHCHGSFATATCTDPACRHKVQGSEIKDAIFKQDVPQCRVCQKRKQDARSKQGRSKKQKTTGGASWKDQEDPDEEDDALPGLGVMKPDITFFGEKLDSSFENALNADRPHADLIIVMGTSLQVAPVAELLTYMPHRIPVILINKTPILHFQTDIMLLGSSDQVVQYLCTKLGWELPKPDPVKEAVGADSEAKKQELSRHRVAPAIVEPARFDQASYIWLWPDAEADTLRCAAQAESQSDDSEQGGNGGENPDKEEEEDTTPAGGNMDAAQ
ncbi:SIR2-domain-containing protein [Tilletiaria anomala UBC 951]|uniref:SIR2-domain-containing protein n=1 Tax=Tilletiaria anomala (strain ATCC 24038 / CBS 436.72 / UBC 951) TaxID=1037660 RepID=A0A066VI74_TILAU|nr:SIR2-domain-containing protein [Tilletiaria anomala UBC 951]KDN40018.1 SIR2-domain-containing protein [Tilletiaria anomala UBC 951]